MSPVGAIRKSGKRKCGFWCSKNGGYVRKEGAKLPKVDSVFDFWPTAAASHPKLNKHGIGRWTSSLKEASDDATPATRASVSTGTGLAGALYNGD